jgi:hypothetical protein
MAGIDFENGETFASFLHEQINGEQGILKTSDKAL